MTLDVSKFSGWLNAFAWNMLRMSVTLDVSKFSGWLNFDARCRVGGREDDVRGKVRVGRRESV